MDVDYPAVGAERRNRPLLRALILLLAGFVAGLMAMGYALTHWEVAARFIKTGQVPVLANVPPAPQVPLRIIAPPPAATAVEQAAMDRRVAALEERIQRIDARASAAVGNADRAEGMLVAFAARRALDRGVALGYIESLLRDRFGGDQPQAVATIISAAHQPVTLDQLQAGLETAAPGLMTQAAGENWWQGMRRELAGLVIVRRADTPSPAPEDRLTRARNALQAGHVDAALAEVARMPGRANAESWITLARRYVTARGALDMIETAALLTPRAPVLPDVATPPRPTASAGKPDRAPRAG